MVKINRNVLVITGHLDGIESFVDIAKNEGIYVWRANPNHKVQKDIGRSQYKCDKEKEADFIRETVQLFDKYLNFTENYILDKMIQFKSIDEKLENRIVCEHEGKHALIFHEVSNDWIEYLSENEGALRIHILSQKEENENKYDCALRYGQDSETYKEEVKWTLKQIFKEK